LNLHVSMTKQEPIYEQLKTQIKQKIHQKKLKPGTQMPSVRLLAKELHVGIVTVKRAYDDLVQEGYLIAKPAVGYFSLNVNETQMKKEGKTRIKALMRHIKQIMDETGLSKEDVKDILDEMEDEHEG